MADAITNATRQRTVSDPVDSETTVLVVGETFPLESIINALQPSAGPQDPPVVCTAPNCDSATAPCKLAHHGPTTNCGSLQADLQGLGWTQNLSSVRMSMVTENGAVSAQMAGAAAMSPPFVARPALHTESRPISIWVASTKPGTRHLLRQALIHEPDITVVGSHGDDHSCLTADLEQHRPDLLLLDKGLFDKLDDGSAEAIRRYANRGRVLLLLDEIGANTAEEILRNQFHGYLLASCPADSLIKAVRAVIGGDIWLPRSILAEALKRWLPRATRRTDDAPAACAESHAFTDREREVLALLKRGLSNKQIARELGVMEDTVKKHLQHVYDKLGVRRRTLVLVTDTRA